MTITRIKSVDQRTVDNKLVRVEHIEFMEFDGNWETHGFNTSCEGLSDFLPSWPSDDDIRKHVFKIETTSRH